MIYGAMKSIIKNSTEDPAKIAEDRWQKEQLAQMWRKFTGKELPVIDETPNKGSGWLRK